MAHYKRALQDRILSELATRPAVFLNGPRQAGKSTLAREIAEGRLAADYVTFDNLTTRAAAESDPEGFLRGFKKAVVLDEAQLVPDIFRALKLLIDEHRTRSTRPLRSRFLLTGSANVLTLPALSDALVGRTTILSLYPLSASESLGDGLPRINGFFDQEIGFTENTKRKRSFDFDKVIRQASFPEIAADSSIDKDSWFDAYLTTLLQRDVRQLAEIEKMPALPNVLKVLAARAGGLLNDADAARDAGLNAMTYRRYRMLLKQLFLITLVPPWYRNIGKRLVKAPKLFLMDTALLCHQLGVDAGSLRSQKPSLFGHVLENFVASELMKQLTLLTDGALHHFRTHDGKEVDFVIERRNGQLLGIEVKGSETVSEADFEGLKTLRGHVGKDFARGIVLYLGPMSQSFGDGLVAMPIDSLWGLNMEVSTDKDIRTMSGDSIVFWADYGERTRIRCRIDRETIEDYFFDGGSKNQRLQAVNNHWNAIWPIFVRKIRNGQIETLTHDHGATFIANRYVKILETRLDPGDFNYQDFRKA